MKEVLDKLYCSFDIEKFKLVDPCGVVYKLMNHTSEQLDIEIGALLVAMISWGSRKVIVPTALNMIENEMKWHPGRFIREELYEDSYSNARNNCVYRTLNVDTFKAICHNLQTEIQDYPTMEARLSNLNTKDAIEEICKWLSPAKIGTMNKSACKRVCMFMRWMVRHDSPDLHLWKTRDQRDLYAVMDTHVCQLTKELLGGKKPSWKTCEQLTGIFREWNPDDPLKYDIALMQYADTMSKNAQLNN
ncbi:MAG: DUF2400 family protein [Prevotellaceae bacterium]|nr:DUF2400 family protein [Candidatus Colivivens equi]